MHASCCMLMRACARRAYCMTENFQRFQRIFNVFCGQVHGKSFDIFLQLMSIESTAVVIPLLNLVEVQCVCIQRSYCLLDQYGTSAWCPRGAHARCFVNFLHACSSRGARRAGLIVDPPLGDVAPSRSRRDHRNGNSDF